MVKNLTGFNPLIIGVVAYDYYIVSLTANYYGARRLLRWETGFFV